MRRSGTRRLLPALSLALGIAVVGLLCWRFGVADLRLALSRLSGAYLVAYLTTSALVILGYSLRWSWITRALGGRVPFGRLVAARLAGDAVGSLVPSAKLAGEPVRVALLYSSGVRGAEAGAGVAIDRVVELAGNLLCAMAYLSVFSLTYAIGSSHRAVVLLLVTLLGLLAALAVPLVLLRRGVRPLTPLYALAEPGSRARWARPLDTLRRTEDHLLHFFRDHPGVFVCGLLASLAIEGLVICQYFLLLAAFAIRLDLPTLLMSLVAIGMARAVPAPGGLGALEAAQVGVLALASGRPDTGFIVGIVMRLHETLWMCVGVAVLLAQGYSLSRLRPLVLREKAAA